MDKSGTFWKVLLELAKFCNFRCRWCYQKDVLLKGRPFMLKRDFYSIVDEIFASPLNHLFLHLTWRGEAILHPQFLDFFSYLLKKISRQPEKVEQLALNTNISLLTPCFIDKFLQRYSQYSFIRWELILSFDFVEPFLFRKYKGNFFSLATIYHNVEYLTERLISLKLTNFILRYQYLINRYTLKEALKFYDYWKKFVEEKDEKLGLWVGYNKCLKDPASNFRIMFLRTEGKVWNEDKVIYEKFRDELEQKYGNKKTKDQAEYSIEGKKKHWKKKVCNEPFSTLSIDTEGNLYLCPKDLEGELYVGNILKQKGEFSALLKGEKIRRYQKIFKELKETDYFNVCRLCRGE